MTSPLLDGARILVLAENPCDPDPRIVRSSESLVRAGAEVKLLAWIRDSTAPLEEERGGVRVERVPPVSGRQLGWRQFPNLLRFAWSCRSRLREDEYDIVVAHDVLMLPFAAAFARRWSAGLVYDAHEIYRWMEAGRLPRIWLALVEALEHRLVDGPVDSFITVSKQRVEQYWASKVRKRPTVVGNWYNPIDVSRERAREDLGLSVGPRPVIAYAGTLSQSRRVDLLLGLAQRRPDITILIAGRGGPSATATVERAASEHDNIHFLGWIEDTLRLLAAADAVFYTLDPTHPYSRFAAPNTLYSAIAANRPLISAAQGEVEWMTRNSRGIIPLGDLSVDALERAVSTLPDWEGWGVVRDQFTWDRSEQQLLDAVHRSMPARLRADSELPPVASR